jgi:hypothetical protein
VDRRRRAGRLGDSGTGKAHLLLGLGLAACEQGRRVRYVTTAALVNELAEAADRRQLSRVVARYGRLDLLHKWRPFCRTAGRAGQWAMDWVALLNLVPLGRARID